MQLYTQQVRRPRYVNAEDKVLTVENDYTAECEVEEERRPIAGVHHGEDDGGDEDQNFDEQSPYDPTCQSASEIKHCSVVWLKVKQLSHGDL